MPVSVKHDETIAREVQRGDIEAFGVLVERYEEKMLRYAKHFLLHNDDAKDAVQDVFLKVYTNIQSFDPDKRFSPWIYRIAHNEFLNVIKKRSRIPVISFDFDALFPHPATEETLESEAEKKELQREFRHSLDKLSIKYREPLVLYYFEDMDYKQIAEVLQVPISTVGVRLKRGKAMLKSMIGK